MTEYANRFAVPVSKFQVPSSEASEYSNTQPETRNSELITRILDQMARELLLAQSSDWAFQIYQGTTVEYSSRRFRSHIQRFGLLAEMLETLAPANETQKPAELTSEQLELLAEIESRDNIFAEIDYSIYRSEI